MWQESSSPDFGLLSMAFLEAAASDKSSGIRDWLDTLITLVVVMGFYLYAYRQKRGAIIFWKLFADFISPKELSNLLYK
jgi:hypothetical protein